MQIVYPNQTTNHHIVLTAKSPGLAPGITSDTEGMLLLHHFLLFKIFNHRFVSLSRRGFYLYFSSGLTEVLNHSMNSVKF